MGKVREIRAVSRQLRRDGPRVNLLPAHSARIGVKSAAVNRSALLIAALAAVSWAVAGVGAALLLGWHPGFGTGP
jgi:hypothetical protein